MIALLRRRPAPDLHARRLAVGLGIDRWPHRGRRPTTILAKLVHVVVGIVLGAVGAAIVLAWIGAGCPS